MRFWRPVISFPWYSVFYLLFLVGWPWFLGIGAVMGFSGLYAAEGRLRRVLLGGAALLLGSGLLSGLAALDGAISSARDDARDKAETARLKETLAAPKTVLDSTLPVGTVVTWSDEGRVQFYHLELPVPTRVFGLLLIGSLEDEHQLTRWAGTLAEDQTIEGWPCRKGDVEINYDRHLSECVLAADHPAFGFVVPAGTQLKFLPQYDSQSFVLPADRTMRIPSLGTTAPALSEFNINHGIPITVTVPKAASMLFRGVALGGEISWHYAQSDSNQGVGTLEPPADRLDGWLASAFACGGHTFPPESEAQLSLVGNGATMTAPSTYNEKTGESASPAVDVSGCVKDLKDGGTGATHVEK